MNLVGDGGEESNAAMMLLQSLHSHIPTEYTTSPIVSSPAEPQAGSHNNNDGGSDGADIDAASTNSQAFEKEESGEGKGPFEQDTSTFTEKVLPEEAHVRRLHQQVRGQRLSSRSSRVLLDSSDDGGGGVGERPKSRADSAQEAEIEAHRAVQETSRTDKLDVSSRWPASYHTAAVQYTADLYGTARVLALVTPTSLILRPADVESLTLPDEKVLVLHASTYEPPHKDNELFTDTRYRDEIARLLCLPLNTRSFRFNDSPFLVWRHTLGKLRTHLARCHGLSDAGLGGESGDVNSHAVAELLNVLLPSDGSRPRVAATDVIGNYILQSESVGYHVRVDGGSGREAALSARSGEVVGFNAAHIAGWDQVYTLRALHCALCRVALEGEGECYCNSELQQSGLLAPMGSPKTYSRTADADKSVFVEWHADEAADGAGINNDNGNDDDASGAKDEGGPPQLVRPECDYTDRVCVEWTERLSGAKVELLSRTFSRDVDLLFSLLLPSVEMFWPRRSDMAFAVVLDDESADDHMLGSLLLATGVVHRDTPFRIVYEQLPDVASLEDLFPGVMKNAGFDRQQYSNFYCDRISAADVVGIIDADAAFVTAVTPRSILKMQSATSYQVRSIGGLGGRWQVGTSLAIGQPQIADYMFNFPVWFRRTAFAAVRTKLTQVTTSKSFEDAFAATARSFGGYCQFNILLNHEYYYAKDKYDWHIVDTIGDSAAQYNIPTVWVARHLDQVNTKALDTIATGYCHSAASSTVARRPEYNNNPDKASVPAEEARVPAICEPKITQFNPHILHWFDHWDLWERPGVTAAQTCTSHYTEVREIGGLPGKLSGCDFECSRANFPVRVAGAASRVSTVKPGE